METQIENQNSKPKPNLRPNRASMIAEAQVQAQKALYQAYRSNPYHSAEPIDPNNLRQGLVRLMESPMPTTSPDESPRSVAETFVVTMLASALAGDNDMMKFVYNQLQHDGVQRSATVQDPAMLTAVNDILASSGLSPIIDVTPVPDLHTRNTPTYPTASEPIHQLPTYTNNPNSAQELPDSLDDLLNFVT